MIPPLVLKLLTAIHIFNHINYIEELLSNPKTTSLSIFTCFFSVDKDRMEILLISLYLSTKFLSKKIALMVGHLAEYQIDSLILLFCVLTF